MRRFEARFGVPILEGYGLTEGTCVSTLNPRAGERKVGSIGRALPGQEVKIVGDDGAELPPAAERVHMDQKGLVFLPHVLAICRRVRPS